MTRFEELDTESRTALIRQLKTRLEQVDTCLRCGRDTSYEGEATASVKRTTHLINDGSPGASDEVKGSLVFCIECRNELMDTKNWEVNNWKEAEEE